MYKQARILLNESLKIKEKFGDEFHIAFTKNILGRVALDEGNLDEAQKLYEESFKIRSEKNDQPGLAGCYYLAGLISEKRQDKNSAGGMFTKALQVWQEKDLLLAEYARMALNRIENPTYSS